MLKEHSWSTKKKVLTDYLSIMPCFELLLVLHCDPLILSPHFLHDPGQIMSFRSVNIHMDASSADLGTQFSNILLRGETVRELFPEQT